MEAKTIKPKHFATTKKMKQIKIIISLVFLFFCILHVWAQNQEKAKALFNEQKYEEAKPVFEKFLKQNPRNGSHNFHYGACLFETGEIQKAIPYLRKATEKRVTEAYRYLALALNSRYQFEEAEELWEKYFELRSKTRKTNDAFKEVYRKTIIGKQMIRSIQDITFIDSIVTDKKDFLEAYRIGKEAGTLETATTFFNAPYPLDATIYLTEMGNKLFYSAINKKDSMLHLYSSDFIGNQWSNTQLLQGIESNGNISFPYLMSDGCTFYYAAEGEESLGGYDIFVTRYDSEENKFLLPENIGMPFNSPYNDYMFVIDEYNNLGWFASDRNQPDGKVCIYIFIPNENMQLLESEEFSPDTLYQTATIHSIKETWKDKDVVRQGKQRLASCRYARPLEKEKYDFEFVIDDLTNYHTLNDFTSPQAKTLFIRLQQEKKKYQTLSEKLEKKRDAYAAGNSSKRKQITAEILDLEQQVETLENELNSLEIQVRNTEKSHKSIK